ncbi:MAG TPA: thioredoxin [Clostridiales bacterium]|nr:thioredoxin [Clostridiales bacterium]
MASVTTLDEKTYASFIAGAPHTLVEFWAAWCGPCKMMSPILDEIAEAYDGKIAVGKINVDDCGDIAKNCHVLNIPTVILMKNGEEAGRIVGYLNRDALLAKIEEMI